jgi:hypothetical protein
MLDLRHHQVPRRVQVLRHLLLLDTCQRFIQRLNVTKSVANLLVACVGAEALV